MGKDEVLVERLRSGDEGAFAEVFELYHRRLVRFAATLVGDPARAEDVAQETWVAAFRGIARFEGRSSLQTWLYQICANRARSMRARDRRVRPIDANQPALETNRFGADGRWAVPPDPWPEVDSRLFADALMPAVTSAIEALPELQRQVVTLRDVEGLTAQEACHILEISEANQRVALHRGRGRLRVALEQELRGRDDEAH